MNPQQGPTPMEGGRYAYGSANSYPPQAGFPAGVSEMSSGYSGRSEYGYSGTTSPVHEYGSPAYAPMGPPPPPMVQQGMNSAIYPDKMGPMGHAPYVANTGAGAGAGGGAMLATEMGMPPKEKTICGLRRRVFFIILGVIIVLIIAGLGAGLGIALTRNKDSSSGSQRDGAGAGGTSSSSSIVATAVTSEPTVPITTEQETIFSTPESPSTPPSDGLISPTLPPETTTLRTTPRTTSRTTPRTTPDPTTSIFSLETGYNTLAVTLASTTGNSDLCSLLIQSLSVTTTIYPSITGNVEDLYTAYWELDGSTGTLTAVGAPQVTADYTFWTFEDLSTTNAGGCELEGGDAFLMEEGGIAGYSSGLTLQSQCTVAGFSFEVGDLCYVTWLGTWSP